MKLIVGLGNPGKKYEETRHNVGFLVLDYFSRLEANAEIDRFEAQVTWKEGRSTPYLGYSLRPREVIFVKPQDFMNNSGLIVQKIVKEKKIFFNDLLVIHDDLDISLGSYKLQFGKGPHKHNGVLSVEEALKTKEFWRLRVGIENRIPKASSSISGEAYVLSDFTQAELKQLQSELFPRVCIEIKNWLLKSVNA